MSSEGLGIKRNHFAYPGVKILGTMIIVAPLACFVWNVSCLLLLRLLLLEDFSFDVSHFFSYSECRAIYMHSFHVVRKICSVKGLCRFASTRN